MTTQSSEIKTIEDLKQAHTENGGRWFSEAWMETFQTKIQSEIIGGKYFITSDAPKWEPRRNLEYSVAGGGREFAQHLLLLALMPPMQGGWTIRSFDAQGKIETVGELAGYKSKEEAEEHIHKVLCPGLAARAN